MKTLAALIAVLIVILIFSIDYTTGKVTETPAKVTAVKDYPGYQIVSVVPIDTMKEGNLEIVITNNYKFYHTRKVFDGDTVKLFKRKGKLFHSAIIL